MIFGPMNLLIYPLMTAVSLTMLGGGIYFLWGWQQGVLTGLGFLVGGIALVLFSFVGRHIVTALLSTHRPEHSIHVMPQCIVHDVVSPTGSRLYVEEAGRRDAPLVILTHGLSMDASNWNYLKRALADRYRIIAWDLPGFGRSKAAPGRPYSLDLLAEDLDAVIAHSGGGPALLAGHSLGGMTVLTYCRRHSVDLAARVSGLILAQTTYTNPVKTTTFHRILTAIQGPILQPLCYLMILLSPILRLLNLQGYLSGVAHLGTHFTGYGGDETPEQLDYAARFSVSTSPAVSARALLAMFRYDVSDMLAEITVPTLVITGDHDLVTRPWAGDRIHRAIVGSEEAPLLKCGHLGLIENHAAYAEAIERWISHADTNTVVVRRYA